MIGEVVLEGGNVKRVNWVGNNNSGTAGSILNMHKIDPELQNSQNLLFEFAKISLTM